MSRAGDIAHCAEVPPSSADRDGTAGDAVRGKAKIDADRSSEINGGVRFVVSGQRVVNSQHERRDGKNTNPENNGGPMQALHGRNTKLPMTVRPGGWFVNVDTNMSLRTRVDPSVHNRRRAARRRPDSHGGRRRYLKAPNPAHWSAAGGIVLPLAFRSERITFLSVEQNRRLPVRSNTSGAAPAT